MSEGNGETILKVGRKGRMKCQLGDGPVFEVDVVRLLATWSEIDQTFRDAEQKVPLDRLSAWAQAKVKFVQDVLGNAGDPAADEITDTEAFEFFKGWLEKEKELRGFFDVRSSTAPSSPRSTEIRLSSA